MVGEFRDANHPQPGSATGRKHRYLRKGGMLSGESKASDGVSSDKRAGHPAAPGWYLDPCALPSRALRFWDGHAWTDRVDAGGGAPEAEPPHWKRRPLAFLGHRWFHIWVPGVVVGIGGAFAYAYTKEPALLVVTAFVLSLASITAFGIFVGGRLRLGQVIRRNEVLAVALVGGVLSAALAYWVEGPHVGQARLPPRPVCRLKTIPENHS